VPAGCRPGAASAARTVLIRPDDRDRPGDNNEKDHHLKIRIYLTLIAAAALVPVILFATAALHMLLDAERKTALRSVQETARATALIVDRELAAAEARLQALGTSPYLAEGDMRRFYDQAKTATSGQDSWIVVFDREGQQVVNTRVGFGAPLPRRTHPERGLETMRSGKTRVTDLMMGPVAKQPVISVELPVPHGEGQRYIISQAFLAQYFNHAFNLPGIPPSWVIGIFGRDGITIARNRNAAQS